MGCCFPGEGERLPATSSTQDRANSGATAARVEIVGIVGIVGIVVPGVTAAKAASSARAKAANRSSRLRSGRGITKTNGLLPELARGWETIHRRVNGLKGAVPKMGRHREQRGPFWDIEQSYTLDDFCCFSMSCARSLKNFARFPLQMGVGFPSTSPNLSSSGK